MNPNGFKLREAMIQGRLARLYADEAAELAERARIAGLLNGWLKQANLTAPPALAAVAPAPSEVPGDLKQKLSTLGQETAKADADFATASDQLKEWDAKADTVPLEGQQQLAATHALVAYRWADALLSEAIESASQRDRAQLNQNLAHVARMAHFYDWAQFELQSGQPQAAEQRIKVAAGERQKAYETIAAALPPVLPAEIAPAPSTQPAATEPSATQPAEAAPGTEGVAPTTEGAAPATQPAPNTEQPAPATEPAATQPAPETAAPPVPQPSAQPTEPATQPAEPSPTERRRRGRQPVD